MSKRETVDSDLNKNDRTNDTSAVLRKKIKVEHDRKESMKALI